MRNSKEQALSILVMQWMDDTWASTTPCHPFHNNAGNVMPEDQPDNHQILQYTFYLGDSIAEL